MPSGMAPHVVWEIVQGQPAQRVEIEHSWGRGEEMATQEQKIVQALGGGAGSTHLMCPHCGKRVDLTYRSSYELALDLAVREPPPDEEARPGNGDKS
jgi:hypothetical protein